MAKKIATYVIVAALGAGLLATTQAISQEGQQPPTPDLNQMMEMYAKLNAPGPEQARFKKDVGTWHTETKMWMGPGEPTVSSGTSEMELLFDGRYLVEHFRCSFMDEPFEGMALVGYDNHKKKHVSIWVDSHSTGIMMTEGTYDEATKTTTMMGDYDDPFRGPMKMKNVIREISKDKYVMEMFDIGPDGKENKTMEINYTRQ